MGVLAHFIIEAVERVGLGAFKVNWAGTGKAQYHPRLMLALLIYCYANGIFSSRRIERATHRDVAVRLVAADQHPDHDTLATFRRENAAAIAAAFAEVVVLARELGLLKLGMVSIDGSKIDANASKVRSLRYDRAQELRAQLDADIAELLARAAAADAEDTLDPQALPKEPDDTPPPETQRNLTDPDSALMRKSKRHEYRQAYNAQAVVDAEGSQLVLSADVSRNAADAPTFQAIVEALCEEVGRPTTVLGHSGFAQQEAVRALQNRGIEVLVAVSRPEGQRRYDFRPPRQNAKPPPEIKAEWRQEMQARMQTEEAKTKYKRRKCTVEPVFGIIKNVLGFTRFHLRGIDNVRAEWLLLTLAYNCCKRLVNLKPA
jgi:transposase